MSEKLLVLIVDDEKDFRDVVRENIESSTSYKVIEADSGLEALALLKKHSANVICVISDYRMPEMDGFELREKMNCYGSIPTIIVSGYVTREMAMSGVETKISAFISKPVNNDELIDALNKHSKARIEEIEEREILEQSFIEESQSIVEELEPLILGLESNPQNLDLLNTIFRLVHTVKGASGVIDNPLITSYLHKYEDLLQKLKSQVLTATPEIVTVLLNGFDGMGKLIDAVESKEEPGFSIPDSIKAFEAAASGKSAPVSTVETPINNADKDKKSTSKKEGQITIQTALLDEFLEQSGEIMVIRNMINKLVTTIERKLPGEEATVMLSDLLEEMHKINSVMQSMIVDLRKIPMNKVLKTIPRAVRDVARTLGKKVDLQFKGDDLRIDNTIGKVLSESLIHLVRNAVDHGLESPEVRKAAGKNEEGKVLIHSYLNGENVIVELSDDGAGINPENIKKKMRTLGYTEDAIRVMPETKLFSMIFDSGFSTAAKVTNVSGRGVGLDMVRASIENIGGKIDTQSDFGKGTTFRLILPIPKSVLIISSMLVEVAGDTFLLPQDDVLRLIQLPEDQLNEYLVEVEGGTLLSIEDRLIPIVSARKVLGFSEAQRSCSYVVVHAAESGDFAFEVDKILDAEDVVVKNAGKYMNHLHIYKGATFMGDGRIALILDVEGIAKRAEFASHNEGSQVQKVERSSVEEKDIVWIDVDRKGEYAIALDEVFRLEEILSSEIECTSKYRVSLYREKIMPIFSLSNLLTDQDPATIPFQDKDSMAVIVFETDGGFVGFEVNSVKDVKNVHWAINKSVNNSNFLLGSIESDDKIIHMIDVNSILANFGMKSLKVANEEVRNISDFKLPHQEEETENTQPVVEEAAGWGLF